MPKSLADGRIKVVALSTRPADPMKPTVAELTAGVDISCRILASDYTLGPTDSDRIAEKELCKEGNSNALGPSNYTAAVTPFRYFGAQGEGSQAEDAAYQLLKTKGTKVYLYERQSNKKSTEAFAASDEVDGYEVITDNPQKPSDMGGYIKRRIPMEVQDAWLGAVVATSA